MKHCYSGRQFNHSKPINIESLYQQLISALNERAEYETQQDDLWRLIKQTHGNHKNEMVMIAKKIGQNTYTINGIIAQLCHYQKTHRAMNLADAYLQKEIIRNERIVTSWRNTIRQVEAGRRVLISSSGFEHTNTQNARIYVEKKLTQIQRLQKWQNYVHSHRT